MADNTIPGFRRVPRTGVIYVISRATDHGFAYGHPEWANLGQGSPETGPMPGAPPRVEQITINPRFQEYGPIPGETELRQRWPTSTTRCTGAARLRSTPLRT